MGGRTSIAIFLVVAAASLAPVGDLLSKILVTCSSAMFICFGRYLAGGVLGLVLLVGAGRFRAPLRRDLGGHVLRAGLMAWSIICLVGALRYAPLADVMAGFYLAPVVSSGLSAAILREQLPPLKTFGTGLALFGAIAILDPTGAFNLGGALAICSGVLFAIYLLAAKMAPAQEDGASAAVVQSLIAAALTAPFAMNDIATPLPMWAYGVFVLIGAISILCQGLTLVAHKWAEASTLAPFFYAAIISSLALGALVLGEAPTPAGMLGIFAIAIGGALIAGSSQRCAAKAPTGGMMQGWRRESARNR